MPLTAKNLPTFKHTYYALRHGESIPNRKKLIVSDPQEGVKEENGLTLQGIINAENVDLSPLLTGGDGDQKKKVLILTSHFSRALQTAEIVKNRLVALGVEVEFTVCQQLRERFFGDFDGKSNFNYQTVWDNDKNQTANFDMKDYEFVQENSQNFRGTESVDSVYRRVVDLISATEKIVKNEGPMNVLLVSHGDALQILQSNFLKENPYLHRSLPHLETCELRKLN